MGLYRTINKELLRDARRKASLFKAHGLSRGLEFLIFNSSEASDEAIGCDFSASLLTHFRLDVGDRLFPNGDLLTIFIRNTDTLWILP